jgi:hypothetical protein
MIIIVRFIRALVPAVREAWAEANGRMCTRACSEMHTLEQGCILYVHDEFGGANLADCGGPCCGHP